MLKECGSIVKQILAYDRFLIVTHRNPDGDTIGSSGALCSALRRAGKQAFLYPNPQFTDKYLEYNAGFLPGDGFGAFQPDCVISTDVSASDMFARGFSGSVDFCIDHHPTNPGIGKVNCIHPEMAACSQILLEIIEAMHGALTAEEATLLYIGLSTDCGCFRYGNTDAAAHEAAAKLIRYGADIDPLNEKFFRTVSPARLKLEGMIYSGLELYHESQVIFATLTQEMIRQTGAVEDDLDDISGLPGRLCTRKISATVREQTDGTSKISVRSAKGYSAIALCKEFGGGGHEAAAGCSIPVTPEKAKQLLLEAIKRLWPEL